MFVLQFMYAKKFCSKNRRMKRVQWLPNGARAVAANSQRLIFQHFFSSFLSFNIIFAFSILRFRWRRNGERACFAKAKRKIYFERKHLRNKFSPVDLVRPKCDFWRIEWTARKNALHFITWLHTNFSYQRDLVMQAKNCKPEPNVFKLSLCDMHFDSCQI